jgi:hypothetical protein
VTSRANRRWSILTEYLRTTPGARRSANPEKSMAAIGARTAWLIEDHPLNHGFGPGSPLEKLRDLRRKAIADRQGAIVGNMLESALARSVNMAIANQQQQSRFAAAFFGR